MTKIEMQAGLLAEEVENFISLGAPVTTAVVTALNQLKFAFDEAGIPLPSGEPAPMLVLVKQAYNPANISKTLTEAQIIAIINDGN